MRLVALSDIHVNHGANLTAMRALPHYPQDWLILGGDVVERLDVFDETLEILTERFAKVIWVPGNHELWSMPGEPEQGVEKYQALVRTCRKHRVLTPEDPYIHWPASQGSKLVICPLFLLYDYSFCPEGLDAKQAIAWAAEAGIRCTDEMRLSPHPYPTRQDWCAARLAKTRARLDALPPDSKTVLINHFPLRYDLIRLFRIPRFSPWCGTRQTEDWHVRYRAEVVVTGHLHMRSTDWRDGVRFEEVSLGYPRHWLQERGAASYLRTILPFDGVAPSSGRGGPHWYR